MIKPSIGRVVWYYPAGLKHSERNRRAALVAFVHNDRMVNLSWFDEHGGSHGAQNVQLLPPGEEPAQDADEHPAYVKGFATWMPFQIGQAARGADVGRGELIDKPQDNGKREHPPGEARQPPY